jgi:hypothetical protein
MPKRDSVPKAVNIGRTEGRQACQNRPLARFQNSKKPVNIGLAHYDPKYDPKPGGERKPGPNRWLRAGSSAGFLFFLETHPKKPHAHAATQCEVFFRPKNLSKPLKTSQNLSKPLKTSQNQETMKNPGLKNTSENGTRDIVTTCINIGRNGGSYP